MKERGRLKMQLGNEVSITVASVREMYAADGYCILEVKAKNDKSLLPDGFSDVPDEKGFVHFTAKGNFKAPTYMGQEMEMVGEWQFDNKYKAFNLSVQYVIPMLPNNPEGCTAFICSVKGIGKKTATAFCNAFGYSLSTLDVDAEEMAAKTKGLSVDKAEALLLAIRRISIAKEATKLLKTTVPASTINDIILAYGENSLDAINNTPYTMCLDGVISFTDADNIALNVSGISKTDDSRVMAGVWYTAKVIRARTTRIMIHIDDLTSASAKLLEVSAEKINSGYEALQMSALLVQSKDKIYFYLQQDFFTEVLLARKIVEYIKFKPSAKAEENYLQKFEEWQNENPDIKLATNQDKAVRMVASNCISMIAGGPGTGKTTVLKSLVETYKKAFPKGDVTLMAPTGLASKRMSESCGCPAGTIHKTLGLIPADNEAGFSDENGSTIYGGLVVIDEIPMVGLHLLNFVMQAIEFTPDTRVVLVGDKDQLPPVSPGAILKSLLDCKAVPRTVLDYNFRQAAGSKIVDGAYTMNEGKTDISFEKDLRFIERDDSMGLEAQTHAILEDIKEGFICSVKKYGLENTYVLSPRSRAKYVKGEITTETLLSSAYLNPILRDCVNPDSPSKASFKTGKRIFRVGDRVINTKNTEEVMNGDIGIVESIYKNSSNTTVVVVDFEDFKVEYTPDKLKMLDLAYCISVHKSQGREFDSVIMPVSMTQGVMLKRNLVYTAVTRAKKKMVIIGSRKALNKAIQTTDKEDDSKTRENDRIKLRILKGLK